MLSEVPPKPTLDVLVFVGDPKKKARTGCGAVKAPDLAVETWVGHKTFADDFKRRLEEVDEKYKTRVS